MFTKNIYVVSVWSEWETPTGSCGIKERTEFANWTKNVEFENTICSECFQESIDILSRYFWVTTVFTSNVLKIRNLLYEMSENNSKRRPDNIG